MVLFAACSDTTVPQPGGDACANVSNGVDRSLCAEFDELDHHPLVASGEELCTRLSVDLLGRRPTPDELSSCAEKSVADVVTTYQSTPEYRLTQRRRWADRFSYADTLADPFAIKELDALVDQMYRGQKKYSDFAIEALAHPAFVSRYLGYGLPEDVAKAAFRTFL